MNNLQKLRVFYVSARIFWEIKVSDMPLDDLAPFVARLSAAMV